MLLLSFTLFILSKTCLTADLNVGSVLFTKADQYKECWSSENLALLTSRMILEDLLPSTTILVIDSNEFVTDLVDYFRLILQTVRETTHGKTKHITLMALTDLLGGYLHHAVLPIAKYSYYAGLIDYDSMATLIGLFDELKWFLRSNGQGWAKPLTQSLENLEIQRIPLQPCNDKEVCDNIILTEGETSEVKNGRCDMSIPLPFFDSVSQPSAVALPTKVSPLHNLEANSSSYLLMDFFVKAYKCLQLKNVKVESVTKFQNEYCSWIEDQVIPRLDDEKFYAAFGGVLRVHSTIKRLDVTVNNRNNKDISVFQHMADNLQGQNTQHNEINGLQQGHQLSRSSMILWAVLITIFVWFLLGSLFICYKMRQSRQNKEAEGDSDDVESVAKTSTGTTTSKYSCPTRPKCVSKYKGKFDTKREDSLHYHKFNLERQRNKGRQRHEITIKTCQCGNKDRDNEDIKSRESQCSTTTYTSETSRTEKSDNRLPSITELSERSTSTPKDEDDTASNSRRRVLLQSKDDSNNKSLEKKGSLQSEEKIRGSIQTGDKSSIRSEEKRGSIRSEEKRGSMRSEEKGGSIRSEEKRGSIRSEEKRGSIQSAEKGASLNESQEYGSAMETQEEPQELEGTREGRRLSSLRLLEDDTTSETEESSPG